MGFSGAVTLPIKKSQICSVSEISSKIPIDSNSTGLGLTGHQILARDTWFSSQLDWWKSGATPLKSVDLDRETSLRENWARLVFQTTSAHGLKKEYQCWFHTASWKTRKSSHLSPSSTNFPKPCWSYHCTQHLTAAKVKADAYPPIGRGEAQNHASHMVLSRTTLRMLREWDEHAVYLFLAQIILTHKPSTFTDHRALSAHNTLGLWFNQICFLLPLLLLKNMSC